MVWFDLVFLLGGRGEGGFSGALFQTVGPKQRRISFPKVSRET